MKKPASGRVLVYTTLICWITGCASNSYSGSAMEADLSSLKGQNIDVAVKIFGTPSGSRMASPHLIFEWSASHSEIRTETVTRDDISGYGYGSSATRYTRDAKLVYTCQLLITTNMNRTILTTTSEGGRLACKKFDQQMNTYLESQASESGH